MKTEIHESTFTCDHCGTSEKQDGEGEGLLHFQTAVMRYTSLFDREKKIEPRKIRILSLYLDKDRRDFCNEDCLREFLIKRKESAS